MENLKVFTAFSGYDSQCLALQRVGVDFDLIGWSEIDRYAIEAHNALFPEYSERNFGDISKIDWATVPDFDLFTYSSPCQDFSQAGLQKGGTKGSGTRSSLLWECERAIKEKLPKFLLMENVAALVTSKFIKLFNAWQRTLEKYGYKNFAKVLNAKDYGVPQNRERIFCISILNGDNYFFPQPKKLQIKLKDILEAKADEKYYIKNTAADEVAKTIISHYGKLSYKQLEDPKHEKSTYLILNPDKEGNAVTIKAQYQRVAYSNIIKHSTDGYAATGVAEPIIVASRGRDHGSPQCLTLRRTEYGKQIRKEYEAGQIKEQRKNIQQLEPRTDGVSNTLTSVQKDNLVIVSYKGQELQEGDGFYSQSSKAFYRGGLPNLSRALKAETHDASVVQGYRIRKLTPRECFRLMGVSEKDIDTIQAAGISPSQQYKLAGNSIVVDVLAAIFNKMFINTENESQQLTLF